MQHTVVRNKKTSEQLRTRLFHQLLSESNTGIMLKKVSTKNIPSGKIG